MEAAADPIRQGHQDARSTEDLIRFALTETDENAVWRAVQILHFRATPEVLAQAEKLCMSDEPSKRTLGANILGQLGVPERAFPEDCFRILASLLAQETNPDVLQAIGVAFGHLHDVRAVRLLLPLRNHPDTDVRLAVVNGMSRHGDEVAIRTLIEMSCDEEARVRDWATFEIGSMIDTDSPEIREALLARVTDTDDDARGEALVGLARRKDLRVLDSLIHELAAENVGLLALEAATELGDPRLGPALLALSDEWNGGDDRHCEQLNHALSKCVPFGIS